MAFSILRLRIMHQTFFSSNKFAFFVRRLTTLLTAWNIPWEISTVQPLHLLLSLTLRLCTLKFNISFSCKPMQPDSGKEAKQGIINVLFTNGECLFNLLMKTRTQRMSYSLHGEKATDGFLKNIFAAFNKRHEWRGRNWETSKVLYFSYIGTLVTLLCRKLRRRFARIIGERLVTFGKCLRGPPSSLIVCLFAAPRDRARGLAQCTKEAVRIGFADRNGGAFFPDGVERAFLCCFVCLVGFFVNSPRSTLFYR